jgi:hypothetical protein
MAVSRNWAHLRDFLRKTYNREVNEWFKDIADEFPDNSTSRKGAKRACLILPTESQNMAIAKMQVFRLVVQRTHLRPDVYALPIEERDEIRKYKPQVILWFKEDAEDVDDGYPPVEGRIAYRLVNETSETITKTELTSIANRIKSQFGGATGYVWRKGKDMASYKDISNGYDFQILCRAKSDAKELITKVLATNNDVPDWKYLQYKESDEPSQAYPTLPSNQIILGNVIREPRRRPIASVRFQYSYCLIWGRKEAVRLYDRTYSYLNALVAA